MMIESFSEKMKTIIKNPDLASEIGKNARECIPDNYIRNIEKFVEMCKSLNR